MKFAELVENILGEKLAQNTVIGQAGTVDKAGKFLKDKGIKWDKVNMPSINLHVFWYNKKAVAKWDGTQGSVLQLKEDDINLLATKFSKGDKVIVDATRFRSGRDPGRRRESYSGTIRKMGEDSAIVDFDKPITIRGKKVVTMSMKHAYLKPLAEAEPGDGAPTIPPSKKQNRGVVKDHKTSSLDEIETGAGAPEISSTDKQNRGSVSQNKKKDVAGTTVVGEDISTQEKGNKGSIVTGKKGAKFAVAVNETIG